jgi:hypothetical protein
VTVPVEAANIGKIFEKYLRFDMLIFDLEQNIVLSLFYTINFYFI